MKPKGFCTIFLEALNDFMLKVLIVAATGSLIFEYIGADPEDYGHGKCKTVARLSSLLQGLCRTGILWPAGGAVAACHSRFAEIKLIIIVLQFSLV